MKLIELLNEIGLNPVRTSATNGGEYHSPCPFCDGNDRFCIWPSKSDNGRYWCRQCQRTGDAIQLCRDYFGLTYSEACKKLNVELKRSIIKQQYRVNRWEPSTTLPPLDLWIRRADNFLKSCIQPYEGYSHFNELLERRGITSETALKFGLVYHNTSLFDSRDVWGLDEQIKENGLPRKVWLPKGLVIPSFQPAEELNKLKIRREDYIEGDKYPKYVEVSGSQNQFPIYGDTRLPLILVEAELDAILLQQEAGDLCCSIALGGAGKKPDSYVHGLLINATTILFSLDFDEPGKNSFSFWKKQYPKIIAWPAPIEKSPAEAHQKGIVIREWISLGISKKEN